METALNRPFSNRLQTILILIVAATLFVMAGKLVAESSLKTKVALVAALVIPIIAFRTGRTRETLLFCWVGSLTYNRQYFSFEALTGNLGTQGPYWIVSDLFLFGILVEWVYRVVYKREATPARGAAFWPWYLPLALMGVVSLLVATQPDWTFYELLRTLRILFILSYVRHNFSPLHWWVVVAAMGLAMTGQSMIGAKEVATGRSGLLGGEVSTSLGGFEGVFDQESFYGMVRATGTLNHPPNFACYLMLVLPVFLGLALTVRSTWLRWTTTLVFLAGCVGLGCSMSRLPIALVLAEAAAVVLFLVASRDLSIKHALGIIFTGIFILILVAIPLRDKIMDRITRDFTASVDQRADGNRVALEMFRDAPWLGVGLNNSKAHMLKYIPELAWAFENEDFLTQNMHSRSIAAMGNGFLFIAVELGIIGILAYAIFLAGTFVVGFRAVIQTDGPLRAACFGLTIGTIGVLLEQTIDFSVWVDPQLYTNALVMGMLTLAPSIQGFPVLSDGSDAG